MKVPKAGASRHHRKNAPRNRRLPRRPRDTGSPCGWEPCANEGSAPRSARPRPGSCVSRTRPGASSRSRARDRALGARDPALHHRQVRPLDGVRSELRLERSLGGGGRGEDEEPGREPIEAVDHEDPGRRLPCPRVGHQVRVHRADALSLRRDGEEPGRLVDDDHVRVLVDEHQPGRQRRARLPGTHLHDVAGGQRDPHAPRDRTVHADATAAEHLLPRPPRRFAEQASEARAERDGRRYRVAHA